MHRCLSTLILAISLLVTFSCGGGSSQASQPKIPAPSNLKAVSPNFYGTNLHWDYPSGANVDHFSFEVSENGGPFKAPGWGTSGNYRDGFLKYSGGLPELIKIQIRIRADYLGNYSDYSETVTLNRGLEPAYGFKAVLAGGIQLTWTNESLAATTIQIDRQMTDSTGVTQAWVPLTTLPATASSYLDQAIVEGSAYGYRVSHWVGSNCSVPQETAPLSVSMLPPWNLQAVPGTRSAHLAWENKTTLATQLVVMRGDEGNGGSPIFQDVAYLPPMAVAYDDTVFQTGRYLYRVEARNGNIAASSTTNLVTTLPSPDALKISISAITFPEASMVFRDHLDRWYLSNWKEGMYQDVNLAVFDGKAWNNHVITGAKSWGSPYVQFDSANHPHIVCLAKTGSSTDQYDILHDWYDGATWHSEKIATRNLFVVLGGLNLTFALDGQDGLHLVWNEETATGQQAADGLRYAHQVGGVWTVEPMNALDPLLHFMEPIFSLSIDRDGHVHVGMSNFASQSVYVLNRSATGVWSAETLPVSLSSPNGPVFLVSQDDQTKFLSYFQNHVPYSSFASTDVTGVDQVSGTWETPYILATGSFGSSGYWVSLASQSSRIAMALNLTTGVVWRDNRLTGWSETLVCPVVIDPANLTAFGIDSQGRLYMVVKTPSTITTPATYSLIQETQ